MGRRALSVAAVLLWLGAGVAFGVFGVRSMQLERDAARRGVERLDLAVLESAVRMLPTVVSDVLENEPADRFVLADAPPRDGLSIDASEPPIGLAQASYLERAGRTDEAEALLLRVANEEPRFVPRATAQGRAGALARRRGDWVAAEPLLRAAAATYPWLLDPHGVSISLLALRHLAPVDATAGIALPVVKLLDASKDGAVVRLDDGIDASDLLIAVADDPATHLAPLPAPVRRRFAAAVATARRGRDLVRATTGRGIVVLGDRIAYRPVTPGPAIVTTTLDRVERRLAARIGANLSLVRGVCSESPWLRRVPAPLDGISIRGVDRSREVRTPEAAVLVWTIGLGLYLVAGLAAMLWFVRNARANRVQADFVAAVSHEMKTPIAGIQAMAEMLADGRVEDPARAHAYAERIRAEASRLGAGVRNVLDAARIERDPSSVVRPVPTEPSALVLDLADVLRPVLEGRGFRFTVKASPSPRPIPIDPDAFGSVVGNLLDNAAKFSTDVKEIDVDAGPVANGYRVTVSDRGPGVPREERERIFERFARGEHARTMAVPGVGLGLHVARNLVKAHGGTIEVLERADGRDGGSQGGGGAVFVVTWPAGASS